MWLKISSGTYLRLKLELKIIVLLLEVKKKEEILSQIKFQSNFYAKKFLSLKKSSYLILISRDPL